MTIYIFKKEDMPSFLVQDIQNNITTEILQTSNATIAEININYKSCLLLPKNFKHVKINVVNPVFLGIKADNNEIKSLQEIFYNNDKNRN